LSRRRNRGNLIGSNKKSNKNYKQKENFPPVLVDKILHYCKVYNF